MRRRARGSDCSQSLSRAAEHSALRETPMTDPSDKMCKHWRYPANVFLLSFAYTSIHHIAQYYVLHDVSFCGHLGALKTAAQREMECRSPHRCAAIRAKNLLKLVLEQHAMSGKPSARAGYGSGARNTKTAREGWRESHPQRESRCFREIAGDPCGSEDPQGYLGQ